ncbi:fatty acyl-CoA reductase 2-like [Pocillopora verrucosa]|uniref:fatty acyl-CoA reductase 2-like n=1 Tax=Pocillopora verrucosa TaxID=203993 RepID=UPI00334078CF
MGSFCSGQRPRMNKLYGKLDRATTSLIFFTSRGWETFNFDVQKLDWNNYFLHFILGLKKFVLKEDMANLPVAQSRIRRLRNIRWSMYFCLFLFSSWLIIKRFPAAQTAWAQCLSGVHKLAMALEPFKLSN